MKIIHLILLITLSFNVKSQDILSLKERARVIEEIQKDRFDNLLPKLMEETGIDMWVIITREYNEDPVIKTLLPPTWLNARRRTILAFHYDKKSKDLEKVAIARYSFGKNIPSIWNKEEEPNQMKALAKFIEEKNPEKIGLNFSDHFALADGIVKTDYELFLDNNGEKISKSKGNGLSIEEWLRYGSPESLSLFMYTNPKRAKRLFFDVIPKTTDEYFSHLKKYSEQDTRGKIDNPVWHLHKGSPKSNNLPVTYTLLLNLVSVCYASDPDIVWGYVKTYSPNSKRTKELDDLIDKNKNIKYFNSLSIFDHDLNLINSYKKINLVPFGEFLPFEKLLKSIGLKTITNDYQSYSKGEERKIIDLKYNNLSLKLISFHHNVPI